MTSTCAAETTYQNCVLAACDAQFKAAYGSGYASGNFAGGTCSNLITCTMKCPCDATSTTCESACTAQMDAACTASMTALSSCALGSGCAYPVCTSTSTSTSTSTTSTSTSTSTLSDTSTLTSTLTLTTTGTNGPSCTAMSSCCTALLAGANAALYQQSCITLTSLGETYCSQVLTSWQAAGLCK